MNEPFDPLDRADIQGNILRPYRLNYAGYAFVRVTDAAAARTWVKTLAEQVTSAESWTIKPTTTLNVAFTCAGLRALEVPETLIESFEPAFQEGMRARAVKELGDTGESHPDRWDDEFSGDRERHILLVLHFDSPETRDDRMGELWDELEALPGADPVHVQAAGVLHVGTPWEAREHFGFADGMSQPHVEHSGMTPRLGQGTPTRKGWKPLKVGEFVLGYEDEDGVLPDAPRPPLGDNGTYMVYRELSQDVAGFRRYVRDTAAARGLDEELLAAKIVGRWRDGTPLVTSPDEPNPGLHENLRNDFRYGDDLDGFRCPLGAHVRRTNPRDALGWEGKRTKRHRLIRRGMPYGPVLAEGRMDDDGERRGLVFICFNASIQRQFETVQGWASDGNIFGLGVQPDFLTAPHAGTGMMTVQGRKPVWLQAPATPFVTTRGGEYLFLPGIDALRAIGAGFPAGSV